MTLAPEGHQPLDIQIASRITDGVSAVPPEPPPTGPPNAPAGTRRTVETAGKLPVETRRACASVLMGGAPAVDAHASRRMPDYELRVSFGGASMTLTRGCATASPCWTGIGG